MTAPVLHVVSAIDAEGPIDNPARPEILSSWERVDGLLAMLFADGFRTRHRDSFGGGGVMSWYVLSLRGFRTNPFQRPMDDHAVFDHYRDRWGEAMARWGDGVHWHYHHPAPSGAGNEWGTNWVHNQTYDAVLARLAIERGFFPASFRAGGRIEDDDTSWWLDEIIPFDFSNNAGAVDWDRRESDGRRLGDLCDWSRAPADWSWYHPSDDDYQRPGGQRRFMFRCPDLASPVHRLADDDIRAAFRRTAGGAATTLAFFEHDRRMNAADHIADAWARIAAIAAEFPGVGWCYADALDAAIAVTGIEDVAAPRFRATTRADGRLLVTTGGRLFGRAPFVAVATEDRTDVVRVPVLTVGRRTWLTDVVAPRFSHGAVAANSPSGRAGVTPFRRASVAKVLTDRADPRA